MSLWAKARREDIEIFRAHLLEWRKVSHQPAATATRHCDMRRRARAMRRWSIESLSCCALAEAAEAARRAHARALLVRLSGRLLALLLAKQQEQLAELRDSMAAAQRTLVDKDAERAALEAELNMLKTEGEAQMASLMEASENDRKAKRCAYGKLLAADISTASATVNDAWKADGSDFRADFIASGNAGENIQALSDALIVMMDKQAKDRKMSYPVGIKAECPTISCPEQTPTNKTMNRYFFITSTIPSS